MLRKWTAFWFLSVLFATCASVSGCARWNRTEPVPAEPVARSIPGITAPDGFPGACVDCHVVYPDLELDVRLSTILSRWTNGVEPEILARLQPLAPAGVRLKGIHPNVQDALADVPAACMECHAESSEEAPSFAAMVHLLHLSAGAPNEFLAIFGGECTHCHKLDPLTGSFSVPSGPEK